MGTLETLAIIQRRVTLELLDLEPIEEPPLSKTVCHQLPLPTKSHNCSASDFDHKIQRLKSNQRHSLPLPVSLPVPLPLPLPVSLPLPVHGDKQLVHVEDPDQEDDQQQQEHEQHQEQPEVTNPIQEPKPEPELRLRVLSLNAWGLPISPKCTERAVEIGKAIDGQWEIVVLQEIWHRREKNIIVRAAQAKGYPYYHYFHPAVGFPVPLPTTQDSFGTGLLVISKMPIAMAMYHSFMLSGRPYKLYEADFIANKGIGLLRIATPVGQIDLYVTHLVANYNHLGKPGPGDDYFAHRTAQAYEVAQFIMTTTRSALVLVCGDFNSPSDSLVARIPREVIRLRDAFTDLNNHDGLTFATEDNKYSHGEHPMRMDYILYKTTKRATLDQQQQLLPVNGKLPSPLKNFGHKACGWQLVHCDVYKKFFVDSCGETWPVSDHFGVTAEFVFGGERRHVCAKAKRHFEERVKVQPHRDLKVTSLSSLLSGEQEHDRREHSRTDIDSAAGPSSARTSSTGSTRTNSNSSSHSSHSAGSSDEDFEASTKVSKRKSPGVKCATRTCADCDALYEEAFGQSAAQCLHETLDVLRSGRQEALERRSGHLQLAKWSLSLVVLLVMAKKSFVLGNWLYFFVVVLTVFGLVEYFLAVSFVALECSSFTELSNQLRLHAATEDLKEAQKLLET